MQPYLNDLSDIFKIQKLIPWHVSCLVQSMVISSHFNKYGIHLPVKLGVSIENEFKAHAWCFEFQSNGFSKIDVSNG
jgi:hypothetical protein